MNEEPLEESERVLLNLRTPLAPQQLRAAVLGDVRRELCAAKWERRLGRVAAVLLLVGIAMNVKLASPRSTQATVATNRSRESLAQVAVAVAEATDAQTGRRVARQLAARAGWSFGGEEAAAVDAAVNQKLGRDHLNGKDG